MRSRKQSYTGSARAYNKAEVVVWSCRPRSRPCVRALVVWPAAIGRRPPPHGRSRGLGLRYMQVCRAAEEPWRPLSCVQLMSANEDPPRICRVSKAETNWISIQMPDPAAGRCSHLVIHLFLFPSVFRSFFSFPNIDEEQTFVSQPESRRDRKGGSYLAAVRRQKLSIIRVWLCLCVFVCVRACSCVRHVVYWLAERRVRRYGRIRTYRVVSYCMMISDESISATLRQKHTKHG